LNALKSTLNEVLASVLPIVAIVLILHFTVTPLEGELLGAFLLGALLIIIGLTIFLFGINQGLSQIGEGLGASLAHSNSLITIIFFSLIIGFFVSFAEPDLRILAKQVDLVTSSQFPSLAMVVVVSIGLGVMMTLGMVRIVSKVRIRWVFLFAYGVIFILSVFSSFDFIAIAFDASGATTGAITVPFMLALATGITFYKRHDNHSEADSFGLVGIASSGAIIGTLSFGLIKGLGKLTGSLPTEVLPEGNLSSLYAPIISPIALDSFFSLLPIIIIFILFQIFSFKYPKRKFLDIIRGIILTYMGLVIFMLGVNGGFMGVGSVLGHSLATNGSKTLILVASLALGLATVLAEPAVHVLTDQVATITANSVRRALVFIFLSLAVGLALFLSALRILVPEIELWMYLLPGFGLTVILAFFTDDLFVGMAYDAGGVASGPMTASFSLAFIQGIAAAVPNADVVSEGFGMIAIVALTPILALEILGLLYSRALKKKAKGGIG